MTPPPAASYLVAGIDIGGTFTDIVLWSPERGIVGLKVASSPPAFENAIVAGLTRAIDGIQRDPGALTRILHGTTVATNAILEHRGATTALVTTRGFRDVLEIGRYRRPHLFDLRWRRPRPLVPRYLRLEVSERVHADGTVALAPDLREIDEIVARLEEAGVESLAISFINAYCNPENEKVVAAAIERLAPDLHVSASHEVLPQVKEYERTSTTVVNAYVRPVVARYLANVAERLAEAGIAADLEVMQSNGGVLTSDEAARSPVRIVESGPAAGVTAAAALARAAGYRNAIAFDMGGTTAKATLIEEGQAHETHHHEVGGGINSQGGVLTGAGYAIQLPCIDVAEVGSGGGSIVWVDAGGVPHVGPESAGADPGPAAYGRGGVRPTVTDANVVLGYLDPTAIAGGEQPIDKSRAEAAVREVAGELDMPLLEASFGIYAIANQNMGRAIRRVSIERGRDPRGFAVIAFGGAGPVHAVAMARDFGIRTVLVPVYPGLFSAVGLFLGGRRYDLVQSWADHRNVGVDEVATALEGLVARSIADSGDGMQYQMFLDMRYEGQGYDLKVPLAAIGDVDALAAARQSFHTEHSRTFGYELDDDHVEIASARLRATLPPEVDSIERLVASSRERSSESKPRAAYFGPALGAIETPVVERWFLTREPREGPLIIEDMDATTVVPPGCTARLDDYATIVIEIGGDAS